MARSTVIDASNPSSSGSVFIGPISSFSSGLDKMASSVLRGGVVICLGNLYYFYKFVKILAC